MDEANRNMFRQMHEQGLIDHAARIIDQFAFRDNVRRSMITRQRIARNKASMILTDAALDRKELLEELAAAHRQIEQLLADKRPDEIPSSDLSGSISRRTALLARHGRLT